MKNMIIPFLASLMVLTGCSVAKAKTPLDVGLKSDYQKIYSTSDGDEDDTKDKRKGKKIIDEV